MKISISSCRLVVAGWFSLLAVLGPYCGMIAASEDAADAGQGIVVTVSPPASDVGLATLNRGGNAVDTAVATAFALAVTWPAAGNIGGGGFMMVYPGPGRDPVCVEYRETAPAAATADLLVRDFRMDGHRVAATPGTVAGLALAHKEWGTLPWRELVMPAVRLARDGFEVDEALAGSLNGALQANRQYAELQRVYRPLGKEKWQAGDRLVQADLARTLESIADGGPDAFYRGPIADLIAAEMEAGGGLITRDDLARYQAKLRKPIHGSYRGYDVYGPPPPSSGGICLVEMLNILENFQLNENSSRQPPIGQPAHWSPQAMHLVIEAMRRAYCDRARHLGDADFVSIPSHLTSKEYAKELAAGIDPDKATLSEAIAPDIPLAGESPETTHFSIIDGSGMAVSNTYTLENSYGCRVVVRGAGFLLNNETTDFNHVPGRTDRTGLIGTPANVIAPGKRMLSSQTPTLVARNGRLVLVTGSPGGRTIINTVLCTILNVVDFGMATQQAVDAPRLHHQWFPDKVRFEGAKLPDYAATVARLRQMGHDLDPKASKQGDAHLIGLDPETGRYVGAADHRIGGRVAAQ
ncbi:MAG: gamma-glutamyltransferase [Planctomycetaceae bacterium]|nr:gamma-glutamyltransferase [Planctomycetaceae bacterium]